VSKFQNLAKFADFVYLARIDSQFVVIIVRRMAKPKFTPRYVRLKNRIPSERVLELRAQEAAYALYLEEWLPDDLNDLYKVETYRAKSPYPDQPERTYHYRLVDTVSGQKHEYPGEAFEFELAIWGCAPYKRHVVWASLTPQEQADRRRKLLGK